MYDSTVPQKGAFILGAPFHEVCFDRIGDGWRDKIQLNPKAPFEWLLKNINLPVKFAVLGEIFYLNLDLV